VSATGFIAAELSRVMILPLALPIAALASVIVLEFPFFIAGGILLLSDRAMARTHHRVTGAATMLTLALAACWYTQDERWVRFVGWQFLALLLLNGAASAIAF